MTNTNSVQSIKQARANSNRAMMAHDLAGITALMDANIVVTVGSGETVRGVDDVRAALWSQFQASPDCRYERISKSIKVSVDGKRAFEEGTWTGSWTESDSQDMAPVDIKASNPKRSSHPLQIKCGGRYAAAWRKTGHVWYIQSEIFVTLYEQ